MVRDHFKNKIDVKEIMSDIRKKIQQEKAERQTWVHMFDQEIDVAMIMRNIKSNCNNEDDHEESSDAFNLQLNDVYLEIERINDYVDGTRNQALRYIEPGSIIPVNTSRPVIIQKILTLCKRLVRKATRFLVLDQMTFNARINECIKALRESQEQNLKLVRIIEQLYQREADVRREMTLYLENVNSNMVEERVRATNQIAQLKNTIDSVQGNNTELQDRIAAHIRMGDERYHVLNNMNTELQDRIAAHIRMSDERYHVLNNLNTELQNRITLFNQDIVNRIEDVKQQFEELAAEESSNNFLTSETYVQFENEFRGTDTEIKSRLIFYLSEYVQKIIRKKERDQILDLGCGRGEWLSLLQESGYLGKGIDQNPAMVAVCSSMGLDAEQGDAVEYLKTLEDCSVKVITGFQVAEHLSMQKLLELIKEAYRVLDYHGVLILETPNCKNIEVGAANFYTDPTHTRPLHPDYMQFVAKETGFYDTDIAMWKQAEIQAWLDSVVAADSTDVMHSPVIRTMLESMKSILYNSPDYALIAIK